MIPRAASSTAALLVVALWAGCQADAPLSGEVGPSPLRRLSDQEYLNALHDLFPAQDLTLPKLPADAVVGGFENAAEAQEPSDVRIARYETIANLYAQAATADAEAVRSLVGCSDWATPSAAAECAARLVENTGRRIFRRPLSSGERDRFLLRLQSWQADTDFESAVRLTLSVMLQSPQFLYRAEPAPAGAAPGSVVPVEPYAMASRLSFLLWESIPDDQLLEAARRDQLSTTLQLRAQADRMLRDHRARRVYWDFHRQALGLDRILEDEHRVRTPEVDPSWTAATQASIWKESKLFVENILMSTGSFPELMTSRRAWVDDEMARLYGVSPPRTPWSEVSLPRAERAGILTRAAFLAGTSHRGGTSPPVRGNALRFRVLCQLTQPPPPGVDVSTPVPEAGEGAQTNRTLFSRRTSPGLCQGCHRILNGFGFGFENYNAAGAYQTTDQGLPVDASGVIHDTDVDRAYRGAVDLSDILGHSQVAYLCSIQQWLRYAMGRAPVAGELPTVEELADRYRASDGNVRELLLDLVTAPSFRMRRIEDN